MRLHHLIGLVEFSQRLVALAVSQDFINALAGQLEESKPLVAPVPEGFNQDVFDAVKQLESIPFEPGERKQAAAKLRMLLHPGASRIQVLVFVHGIFSTAVAAFREMFEDFVAANSHWCALFDYDFTREITSNGKFLAERLEELNDRCDVTLICHSMGGLVGRSAVLTGKASCIRRLIMLGTPNFGALRTAQLGLLSQLAMADHGMVYAVHRKPGIRDLTRVSSVFEDPIKHGAKYSDDVEYVTIPGAFFHEGRRIYEIGNSGEWQLWIATFAALNAGAEFLTAVLPLWKISLEKPHDGIVERRSNCFVPSGPGRNSEKKGVINDSSRFGRTYLHAEHTAAEHLTHVQIQHDPDIIALVRGIVSAPTLVDWYKGLTKEQLRELDIIFP